jgi:endonuclease/exonuclease/phosphatase family metal-dependent hydrolase
MNRLLFAASILLVISLVETPTACSEEFAVASWNVENLFDTEDDPNVQGDEEYTPDQPKQWTPERLDTKLANLAKILNKVHFNKGPDILGVCEIENRKVVEMLAQKLGPDRKYEIVHKDSPSERGIDCALLFDPKKFTLVDSKFHAVGRLRTRYIVEAQLKSDGDPLYVFMNHWPSRHNDESQRIEAADVLRKRVDEILAADAKADIIMMGDFNDEPANASLKNHLRASTRPDNLSPGTLYDTTAPIKAANKGTLVYENKWNLLDHIIISQGLMDEDGFHWKEKSSRRMEVPTLFFHPRGAGEIDRPNQSYTRDTFHKNGYSDHLPIECIIEQ